MRKKHLIFILIFLFILLMLPGTAVAYDSYTVSFNTNGGSSIDDITAEYGSTITAPSAPTKTGYTFNGWYKDAGLNTPWNFALDTITADAILYAEWIPLPYTVTFDSNGGTEVESITSDYDSKISAPAEPTQTGYKFDGWYKDESLSTAWDFDVDTIAGETTLYAKWEALLKVTYFTKTGVEEISYAEAGTIVNGPGEPAAWSGYAFKGWYMEQNFMTKWDGQPVTVNSDTIFYARWLKDGYFENDYFKLQQFLNSPSAVEGKLNGQILNASYDANNPTTWRNNLSWISIDGLQHIRTINWYRDGDSAKLAGDIDLSNCTSLIQLYCDANQIDTLILDGDHLLSYVSCRSNQLETLDITDLPALTHLDCSSNQLLAIDSSNNPLLGDLLCADNQLSFLNVNNNIKLTKLSCSSNPIKTVDISNNPELIFLYCADNQLNTLDITNNAKLTNLYCSNNQLSTLNLNKNIELKSLVCEFNQLNKLDLTNNPMLTYLNCPDNELNVLIFNENTNLEFLNCENNQLTSLDLSRSSDLYFLRTSNNKITSMRLNIDGRIKNIFAYGNGYLTIFSYGVVFEEIHSNTSFMGWTINGTTISTEEHVAFSDITSGTLIANFSRATVNFDSQGGTIIDSKIIPTNSCVSKPSDPTREDNTFIGWYKEPECKNIWNFATDTVTINPTLYAAWNNNIVTFDSNSEENIDSITISFGSTINDPNVGDRIGYSLAGWYTEPEFINIWDFDTDTIRHDMTLYAKWQLNTYTIAFNTDTGGTAVSPISANYNSKITAPTPPVRRGYSFTGWYKDAALTTAWNFSTDKVTANTTLYAKWTINSYTVTFNSNGGSSVGSVTANYNTAITKPTAPTKTGYTFAGWYKDAALTTAWNFSTDKVTTDDITLYAKWTINSYTVTFNSNGGSTVGSVTANYNTTITKPTDPTKTGYTFAGWYKNSALTTAWNFSTDKVTAATTLYAKWTINKYTLSVSSNNTSYGTVTGAGTYDYNSSATLKATPKAGYRFVRWLEGTTTVSTNSTYSFTVTKGRTLKAEFAKIATPSISSASSSGYNSVTLKWGSVTGANSYNIYRATSKSGTYSKIASTTSTSYKNTSLTTGKTYYYKVKAVCVAGSTTTYSSYSAYKYAKPIPSTPSTTIKSNSYTSIKISWGKISGASGYKVYRATSKTGTYSLIKTTTSTSYTNSSLKTGKTYYYKVRAYRTVGSSKVYSSYSAYHSAKPVPSAPSAKVSSASYNSIKVSWSKVSGATKYQVYRKTSSTGSYSLIKTTTSTSYTNTSLTTGKTYYYKVRAYHLEGSTKVYGSYSALKSVAPIPATPKATAVSASSSSIKISWGAVSGRSGYEVYSIDPVTQQLTLIKTTSYTSYTHTGLTTGSSYSYKVRAYKTVNGTKVYSKYSSAVSATPLP